MIKRQQRSEHPKLSQQDQLPASRRWELRLSLNPHFVRLMLMRGVIYCLEFKYIDVFNKMQSEGEVKERLQNMSTQSLLEGGLSGQKQVVHNTKLFLAKREIYCCGTFQQMGAPGSRDARWQFLQICIQIGHKTATYNTG